MADREEFLSALSEETAFNFQRVMQRHVSYNQENFKKKSCPQIFSLRVIDPEEKWVCCAACDWKFSSANIKEIEMSMHRCDLIKNICFP